MAGANNSYRSVSDEILLSRFQKYWGVRNGARRNSAAWTSGRWCVKNVIREIRYRRNFKAWLEHNAQALHDRERYEFENRIPVSIKNGMENHLNLGLRNRLWLALDIVLAHWRRPT